MRIIKLSTVGLSLLALIGCSSANTDSPSELASTDQALVLTFPVPLPLMLPPEWARCADETLAPGFFVRRAAGCGPIAGANGTWNGLHMFKTGSGFCRYGWSSTTSAPPDYVALENAADYASINRSLSEKLPSGDKAMTTPPLRHDVRADCRGFEGLYCRAGASFPPISCTRGDATAASGDAGTILIDGGTTGTIFPLKGVNPCGACGQAIDGFGFFFLPWVYTGSDVYVQEWNAYVEPRYDSYTQAYVVPVPSGEASSGVLHVTY